MRPEIRMTDRELIAAFDLVHLARDRDDSAHGLVLGKWAGHVDADSDGLVAQVALVLVPDNAPGELARVVAHLRVRHGYVEFRPGSVTVQDAAFHNALIS
jgi:hypothetical protein